MPRVLRRWMIDKPVNDVIRELTKEGWKLIIYNEGKALFIRDPETRSRITKSKFN